MSGNNDRSEREDRAFDALIVSHLLRDRDFNNLDDLPQLTESLTAKMNSVPDDLVEQLWKKAEAELSDEECEEPVCDQMDVSEELEMAGMNRAEDMDEETKKRLDEARSLVLDAMKARKKAKNQSEEKGDANTSRAELAEETLRSHRLWRLPVDPLEIIKKEGIDLAPGIYGDLFDARIEYYRGVDEFCIFYERPGGWRTEGRVKFTLAHELGHFYLPDHRQRLRDGHWHNSVTDFVSHTATEAEADEFAADLIMPMELFRKELKNFRGGFCTLTDLETLANRLGTSITSTARRYCESDGEACTIFFSEGGRVRWGKASEDMNRRGMFYHTYGTPPPASSKTAEYWTRFNAGECPDRIEGRVDATVWFQWPRAEHLWEDVMPLGNTGRVITQLTPAE